MNEQIRKSRADRIFEDRNRAFRVIYDMLFEVEGLTDSKQLFSVLCKGLCNLVQARAVALASVNSITSEITLNAIDIEDETFSVSWGRDAPRVKVAHTLFQSLYEEPVMECPVDKRCVVELFPEEFDMVSKIGAVGAIYRFSMIRGGELLGAATIFLHEDQKLRMKDMIDLYLTTAGIVIQRIRGIDALKDSKEQFRMIADFTYDWEYWVDESGQCLYVSPACERISGYKRQEFLENQQLLLEITHPEDRPLVKAHLCDEKNTRHAVCIQFRIITRNGEERWIEHTCQPVYDKQGIPKGRRGSNHDITEQKVAAVERARLESQIQHTQKLESLGVLAGGIAHDFNNLLMGILGNADVTLMRLPEDSPARLTVESIKQASKRAADLCSQMLAYAGKGQLKSQIININDLIHEMAHFLRVSIPRKIQIKYDFDRQVTSIKCDVGQIRQVVMNLITNAADAIGDIQGVISLRTAKMNIQKNYIDEMYAGSDLEPGEYILIEVSDTGCGMDKVTQEKLFDPFFTTKFAGHGLGMSSVLGIIKSHHGAIGLQSEPGKGTTFSILLPFVDGLGIEVAADEKPDYKKWVSPGGTVLVVDDEDFVCEVAIAMLSSFGFSVITAHDGEEAIRVFKQQADEICVVLMDMTMPNMDGEESAREIRKIKQDIPIILASGYAESDALSRLERNQISGFLHKPYERKALIEMLRQALEGV